MTSPGCVMLQHLNPRGTPRVGHRTNGSGPMKGTTDLASGSSGKLNDVTRRVKEQDTGFCGRIAVTQAQQA